MYLLAELCFNLSQLAEKSIPITSSKDTLKKTTPQLKLQPKKKKSFKQKNQRKKNN